MPSRSRVCGGVLHRLPIGLAAHDDADHDKPPRSCRSFSARVRMRADYRAGAGPTSERQSYAGPRRARGARIISRQICFGNADCSIIDRGGSVPSRAGQGHRRTCRRVVQSRPTRRATSRAAARVATRARRAPARLRRSALPGIAEDALTPELRDGGDPARRRTRPRCATSSRRRAAGSPRSSASPTRTR